MLCVFALKLFESLMKTACHQASYWECEWLLFVLSRCIMGDAGTVRVLNIGFSGFTFRCINRLQDFLPSCFCMIWFSWPQEIERQCCRPNRYEGRIYYTYSKWRWVRDWPFQALRLLSSSASVLSIFSHFHVVGIRHRHDKELGQVGRLLEGEGGCHWRSTVYAQWLWIRQS